MIKQKAIGLLDDTFNHNFEINQFSKFMKELLNEFTLNSQDKTQFIAKKYVDYIESLKKIGDWEDKKGKEIEVLVVKLKKTSSRDRARTMQRDFIASLLGESEKDAALVAFYGDDPNDWRFSYVKMEYNLVKDDSGKSKPVKELTPAKRYSFLVGVNEPNHTCSSQFIKLIMEEKINPSLEEIEQAFSIEKVTKEFFEKYKDLFLRLTESLEKLVKKDSKAKNELEDKGIDAVDFTKKLLGQIVFLYFLQKKGWLGVEKNKEGNFDKWGTGPKDFMKRLFSGNLAEYDNFFNDILEPLFYEALATERDDDYYSRFKCKIPFLNGGLFEPINDYNWRETDILIDNDIFRDIFKTFDEFNFTVKEDEPLEREVAVDPEMLGKVFENLLEVKDRKSKGAFYTPREIVHYMCQQSLINYLETNSSIERKDIENFILKGDNYLALTLLYESKNIDITSEWTLPSSIKENYKEIDKLLKEIKIIDPAVGSGAFPIGMMNEIVKARSILSTYFKEDRKDYDLKRETIENCLYGVDIESSAVEITKLRFWLSLIVDELDMKNIKPLPNLDHKIMCGNSLLEEFEGVKLFDERLLGEVKKDNSAEIKQVEGEIAELNKEKGKIATGKSNEKSLKEIDKEIKKLERKKQKIISGPKEKETFMTLDEIMTKRIKESKKKLSELNKLQKQFFKEPRKKIKKQLREDIDRIEWELIEETLKEEGNEEAIKKLEQIKKTKSKPFFLWKLYFAEVFQRDNPGFDVVIGNPPYVRVQSINQSVKEAYADNYLSAKGKYDLYILFTELAIKILRTHATMSYIMPNKFTNALYGKALRGIIVSQTTIAEYIDFNDRGVFESATNYPFIINIIKTPVSDHTIDYSKIKKISSTLSHSLYHSKTKDTYENDDLISYKIQQNVLGEKSWVFVDQEIGEILNKFEDIDHFDKLIEYREKIYEGLITGNNKIYFISDSVVKEFNIEREIIKKLPKGKKIKKYFLGWDDYYVIYPYEEIEGVTKLINLNRYPNAKKYLECYKTELLKRKYLVDAGKKWYEIWNPRTIEVYDVPKIITPNLSKHNRFVFDDISNSKNYICIDHDCYGIILKDKSEENYLFFLGLLNSPITDFYIRNISPMFSGGYWKYHTQYIEKIPIPKIIDEKIKNDIINKVRTIHKLCKEEKFTSNPEFDVKIEKMQGEIDELVYKLYELTPDEIKIIEEFNK